MINCMGVIVVRLIYCCPSECSESFWLRCVAPSPGERLSQHSTTRHWRYPSMPCQRTSKTVISAWRLVRFLWRHPPFATLCRAMFDSLVLPLHTLLRRNWKLLCSLLHTYSVTWRQRLCILGLYSAIEIVLLLLLLLLLTHGDVYTLQPPTPSSFRRPVSLSLSLSLSTVVDRLSPSPQPGRRTVCQQLSHMHSHSTHSVNASKLNFSPQLSVA